MGLVLFIGSKSTNELNKFSYGSKCENRTRSDFNLELDQLSHETDLFELLVAVLEQVLEHLVSRFGIRV